MPDTKANILIVDDRPEKLLSLEAVLEDLNENVVTATSGREALRHVLATDFAVILLDVNMPGMDGFETASLIRQRQRSEHTPIIFVTAFGDEMHASRGYQLGAVDYILAPIMPDVLRTKVAVFVDLYKKADQISRQAANLKRRAEQLQKLAAASLAINSALSMEQTLQSITDAARDIVGSHQAVTLYVPEGTGHSGNANTPSASGSESRSSIKTLVSFSAKNQEWKDRPLDLAQCAQTQIGRSTVPVRLTHNELLIHPDWKFVKTLKLPPIRGVLAAPLLGRDGGRMGLVYLTDKVDDSNFSSDDEAILVQLTQLASVALENIIFSKEREANRLKDEFLATLSHELRTPLNAIVGWTQLLQMEELPKEMVHGLQVIDRNAKSQAKLIEDLLDVSRITTGKLRLKLQQVDVCAIVNGVIETVRPNATAKGIQLQLQADVPAVTLDADPDRLQQVVWNLLTNAVKFTPQGGNILVHLSQDERGIRLDVTDTGAGIEPKFLPYVFDRFRQADSTSTRSYGGLGIGLTIVRHIVELHGGTVEAKSDGLGTGATFSVCLPIPTPSAGERATPSETADSAIATIDMSEELFDLNDVAVLVVDDEVDARDVIAEILRRAGAQVTTSSGADEALSALPVCKPTVLVSDIAMPEMDGYALIERLRARPASAFGTIPAIALTAYARAEDRARTLAAGFDAYLAKPVEAASVIATVARLGRAVQTMSNDSTRNTERRDERHRGNGAASVTIASSIAG